MLIAIIYSGQINQIQIRSLKHPIQSMIEGLKSLEEYLQQNNLKKTLQTLRAELFCQIPNKPSQQFFTLFQPNQKQNQNSNTTQAENPQRNIKTNAFSKTKSKLNPLPVEGLLGKIAYSPNLIQDNGMTQKINHMMDNKIFIGQLKKMFPQTKPSTANQPQKKKPNQQQQYHDQLDFIEGTHNDNSNPQIESSFSVNQHQISAIEFCNDDEDNSVLSQPSQILEEFYKVDTEEEYTDDRDCGYYEHIFDEESLMKGCQELSAVYRYPDCAVRKEKKKDDSAARFRASIELTQKQKFPKGMVFPTEEDNSYPLEWGGVSYDVMKLKIVYDREKIGFEDKTQLQLKKGDIIAGRYQIEKILGNGVFAKVIKCRDLNSENDQLTCFKIIQNDKDFFDQALDELKLLRYVKSNCNPNDHYLLNFKQVFYHRQHLFIETDLLKDNLLTAFQTNPSFFSLTVIKKIAIQLLQAIATLHSMNIIHADLKPENIMVKSYNPIEIRVIDLGNGSFTHDRNLSIYVQSRSYRAPQVILGCGYNQKIDIWSLGCILAQLWTKNVLFFNHHVPGMIARIQSIVGPWPQWMLQSGENVVSLFSNQNFIYWFDDPNKDDGKDMDKMADHGGRRGLYHIFVPKKTTLKNRIRSDDQLFVDFIRVLVEIDPLKRVSALQAMEHPFLK